MSNADAVIAALRTGHDVLAKLVPGLSDDDLAAKSGSAQWDVAQVLSHLGSGAEITQSSLEAALAGQPRPGQEFAQSVWARWDAMPHREQAEGFLAASASLTDLLESVSPELRETLRIDTGFMPVPVDLATFCRLRLNELTFHGWDVRVTFDSGATLPRDAAEAMLHGEPHMIGWISKPDQLDGRHSVLQVTTTEPSSVFTLLLGEKVDTVIEVPAEHDGEVTLPAEAWLRLTAGRLAPEHTPGDVTATGAADLAVLRRVFPGY